VTDADGRASVSFALPDSITRYRIWAVAATSTASLSLFLAHE
jgi:uncharacterized protein YfaS (alpha-2-macroglobulin family)